MDTNTYPPAPQQGWPTSPGPAAPQNNPYPPPPPPPRKRRGSGWMVTAIVLVVALLAAGAGNVWQFLSHGQERDGLVAQNDAALQQVQDAQREAEGMERDVRALEDALADMSEESDFQLQQIDVLKEEIANLKAQDAQGGTSGGEALKILEGLAFIDALDMAGQDLTNPNLEGMLYHQYNCPNINLLTCISYNQTLLGVSGMKPCPDCH